MYILQLHCSLIFFVVYIRGTDLDKKEERTFNKCSVYVNVDVQLFWKLLLPVWKATDNSVFRKLIPHPHSSNQEECVAYETRYHLLQPYR